MKTLVVFCSSNSFTSEIAHTVSTILNADLCPLNTTSKFSGSDAEKYAEGIELELAGKKAVENFPDVSAYDDIVVCGQDWAGNVCTPVKEFLMNSDLSGKTVTPIWTHGIFEGPYEKQFTMLCKNAHVEKGMSLADYQEYSKSLFLNLTDFFLNQLNFAL